MNDFRQRLHDAYVIMERDPRQRDGPAPTSYVRMTKWTFDKILEEEEKNGFCVFLPEYDDKDPLFLPVATGYDHDENIRITVGNLVTTIPVRPTGVDRMRDAVGGLEVIDVQRASH